MQLERSTVIRCALGFYYCTRGEFPNAGAVLSAASEHLRQLDGATGPGRGISKHITPHAQLILSTVLWSVLGNTADFNWAVRNDSSLCLCVSLLTSCRCFQLTENSLFNANKSIPTVWIHSLARDPPHAHRSCQRCRGLQVRPTLASLCLIVC
jgi:hypothetical protein